MSTKITLSIIPSDDGMYPGGPRLANGGDWRLETGANGATVLTLNSPSDIVEIGGEIGANLEVILPSSVASYLFKNGTAGAFSLTVKTEGGGGVAVASGAIMPLLCDGVSIVSNSVSPNGGTSLTTPDGWLFN